MKIKNASKLSNKTVSIYLCKNTKYIKANNKPRDLVYCLLRIKMIIFSFDWMNNPKIPLFYPNLILKSIKTGNI